MITVSDRFKAAIKGAIDISKVKVLVEFSSSIWTDISAWVLPGMNGRSEEVDSLDGGSSPNWANLTLNNDDGRFSPANTASPYYPNLTPTKPIVIFITVEGEPDLPIFTGVTGNWLPSARSRVCSLKCYDAAMLLVGHEINRELVYNAAAPSTGRTWNWVFERAAWLAGIRWDWVTTRDATFASTSQLNANGTTSTITVVSNSALTTAIYRQGGSGGTIAMRIDIARSVAGAPLILFFTWLEGLGLKVLADLAQVIDGKIFFDAQGALRLRSRMYVGDSATPDDTLTVNNFDDVVFSQNYEGGSLHVEIVNKATLYSNPLKRIVNRGQHEVTYQQRITWGKDGFSDIPDLASMADNSTYPPSTEPAMYLSLDNAIFSKSKSSDKDKQVPGGGKILRTSSPAYPAGKDLLLYSYPDGKDDSQRSVGDFIHYTGYPIYDWDRIGVKITNHATSRRNLSSIELYANMVFPSGSQVKGQQIDATSVALLGTREKTFTNNMLPDALAIQNLASWIVFSRKDVKNLFNLPLMHAMPWVELGDTLAFSETITNTQPTVTNGVPRAYSWKIDQSSYTQTFETAPPDPAFTLTTVIGGITEISTNHNSGMMHDQIPFPALSGVGKQIGLNNISAFNQVLNNARKFKPAGTSGHYEGLSTYRGYVFAVTDSGDIQIFDPLTLVNVKAWNLGANYQFYACIPRDGILYVFAHNSTGSYNQVLWFDMGLLIDSLPATLTVNTHWGIKINETGLKALNESCYLFVDGNTLWIHGIHNDIFTGDYRSYIRTVDITNTDLVTGQSLPYCFTTQDPVATGVSWIAGGIIKALGYIWALSFHYSETTTAWAVMAGENDIYVADVSKFSVGDFVSIGDESTSTADYGVIQLIIGSFIYLTEYCLYNHAYGATVTKYSSELTKYNISDNTAAYYRLNLGSFPLGMEWDGQFAWMSFGDKIAKCALSSTGFTLIGTYSPTGVPGGGPGYLMFDGTYIWWARIGALYQIDPRSGYPIGMFPGSDMLGGIPILTGESIIVNAPDNLQTLYRVPRWSSMSI